MQVGHEPDRIRTFRSGPQGRYDRAGAGCQEYGWKAQLLAGIVLADAADVAGRQDDERGGGEAVLPYPAEGQSLADVEHGGERIGVVDLAVACKVHQGRGSDQRGEVVSVDRCGIRDDY